MVRLIDTSVWVDYLRPGGAPALKLAIDACIDAEEALYTCPVLYELIAGARENEVKFVRTALSFCERHRFQPSYWDGAAVLAQRLLRKGITVSPGDIQIAYVAMQLEVPVLTNDKHFDLIHRVVGKSLHVQHLK